ncbi:NADH dehydrogenase [ubiquinone] 1 alpha subcomplex subunit 8-B isoform X1 [Elaeis guineensis]|uniref:NADH dehydrogenase [ubiquinone] 1 alpha subcomplex subunit 8-B isoform X1 n=1 Tax=Elaeis guineensis var. tenera TaxID=51953 RepID=UPI003C6D75F1
MSGTVDAAGEPIPTSAVLMAASRHIAVRCRAENMAFINCKKKDPNPEKCLDKGRAVTRCVLNLYRGQFWTGKDLEDSVLCHWLVNMISTILRMEPQCNGNLNFKLGKGLPGNMQT